MKPTTPLVMIADDDTDVTVLLARHIEGWGYSTVIANDKRTLLALLSNYKPTLLLLDLRFGTTDGLELLPQLLQLAPDLMVALLTAHGSIDTAVAAMKLGAYDFLTKPPDLNRLKVSIKHAVEKQAMNRRIQELEEYVQTAPTGIKLLGDSPAMQQVVGLIRSVAQTDASVLILGESGTGKELVAKSVHELSRRASGPFVPINMAALPRDLAESLLFGHEKGAFTGADKSQAGSCELADNGTLFLDEIGEMDVVLQAKILRFLQERTVQRVGSPKRVQVDVRVIAATNRNLLERVREGQFREDLYYRLNVVPIRVPPLRQRKEDIPQLAARFLQRAALSYGRVDLHFRQETLTAMSSYDWPGNVRQLENLVERMAILSPTGEVGPDMLQEEVLSEKLDVKRPPSNAHVEFAEPVEPCVNTSSQFEFTLPSPSGKDGMRLVDQVEKQAIEEALRQTRGNVRDAASMIGLSQATIYRKIKRYDIDLDIFSGDSKIVGVS
ncbi:sigma-54-dependent Fis family transcriptional regulator [Telmatocola sphagniphila]|uniref:Sigma-54-dependent Fis family transcriptional regulator n=1 Tax=Telmatocola sphagniphila TaxID=1123043 RepID=A0A8E6B5S9_9BACT|nr:sigma-54 dependent transcriptional regulator [Telmatocola sphagniphila]QVL31877.1 sigma-54-dependent Fis family transcriptional regulator [Telmatocola sphagniphila]